MLSHVCVGVGDFARAFNFYGELAEELGWRLKFADAAASRAAWMGRTGDQPLFVIRQPFNTVPAGAGNSTMIALDADSRDMVRLAYAVAIAGGGACEGVPGLRPHYHPHCYAAYFRDPDGNKLCVVCHHEVREAEL